MTFMKAANMANILLAGYATPYKSIKNIIQNIFVDISEYLESVFSGKTNLFNKYSTMRILFFSG